MRQVTGDDIVRLIDVVEKLIKSIEKNTLAREKANHYL